MAPASRPGVSRPLPLPPVALARRVGDLGDGPESRQLERYESIGAALACGITNALPDDWSWGARRALDFGCGAGRVLRHFVAESVSAEFWGCDIDAASIAWMRDELCPPFHASLIGEEPGLPHGDDFFDVVWAMSVFTHLTNHWASWLIELHRVMKPGAYLISTFLGVGMSEALIDEPWDEQRVGMNVVGAGRSWDEGGPLVFHSEWWLRAHWGRAFEIERIEVADRDAKSHGLVVLRKKPAQVTASGLEAPEPGEPRELDALRHNIYQLHREDRRLRAQVRELRAKSLPRRLATALALGRAARGRTRSLVDLGRRRVRGFLSDT